MVTINLSDIQTARNILYCIDDCLSHSCDKKFMRRLIEDKAPIRRAIGKVEGIPISMLKSCKANDYRKYGLLRI